MVAFFMDLSQRMLGSDMNFSFSVEHSIVLSVCHC